MKDTLSILGLVLALSALIFGGLGAAPVHAVSMGTYMVQPGDTLAGIAARYGVSVSQLAHANGLSSNSWVYIGQRLTIPVSDKTYTVQRGDTLSGLALRFGTSSRAIMQANGLTSTRIYVGQRLIVPASDMLYTVQWGDTLSGLAGRFGTTVDAIVSANNLHSTTIIVGQQLLLPGQATSQGTIAISPTSGLSGTIVEVVVSGFPSHTPLTLALGPENSEFVEVARGTTDPKGRFAARVPVRGSAGMNWIFGAHAGATRATSGVFHITNSAPAVAISPSKGPSGTLVRVVGSGFRSYTSFSIGVGPEASEFSEVARGVTDAGGGFIANVRVEGAPGTALVLGVAVEGQPGIRPDHVFRITG